VSDSNKPFQLISQQLWLIIFEDLVQILHLQALPVALPQQRIQPPTKQDIYDLDNQRWGTVYINGIFFVSMVILYG
jgi:hypothetical protein